MITAKNYAAQAEKHLRADFKKHCNTEDYDYFMECFVDKIKDSVHFALDLSKLSHGQYILLLSNENSSTNQKIILE